MKRTQLILLFMLVLCGAVLVGTIPAWAQTPSVIPSAITGVTIDNGHLVTDLSGQTPINPCYNPNPTDPLSSCEPMVLATDFRICDGPPAADLSNCREHNYSTFGVAYNVWTVIGGIVTWVNLPCSATIKCVPPKICKLSTGKCVLP
jgi:hypothetical protein